MTWVFLPGMDGTGDLAAPIVKQLSKHDDLSVVARYPRQHVCDRNELYSIAREVSPDFEDYILVAESFSGPFAVEIASKKPARMRGLVLVATFATSPIRSPLNLLFRIIGPLAMMLTPPAFVIRSLLTGPDSTDDQVKAVQSAIESVSSRVLASRLSMMLLGNVTVLLPHIKVPTLVIGATHDRLISRDTTEQLVRGIANAILQWIDSPHLALFTKPELAVEVMRQFAASLPPPW